MSYHYYTRHADGDTWVEVPKNQYEKLMWHALKFGKEHRLFATMPRDKETEFLEAYETLEPSGPRPIGHLMFGLIPDSDEAIWLEVWTGGTRRFSVRLNKRNWETINYQIVRCVDWMRSHGIHWDEQVPNLETKRVFVVYLRDYRSIHVCSADLSGQPSLFVFKANSDVPYEYEYEKDLVIHNAMCFVKSKGLEWDGKVIEL